MSAMRDPDERLYYLIDRFFQNTCTDAEKKELAYWIQESDNNEELKRHLEEAWRHFEPIDEMTEAKADEIFSSVISVAPEKDRRLAGAARIVFLRRLVAACIVVLAGIGIYLLFREGSGDIKSDEFVLAEPGRVQNDAAPGEVKAILTLSDGSQVILDTLGDKTIEERGNYKVESRNGRLFYNSHTRASAEVIYNTLETRRGEQYPVILSDGTRVWLNAASSIRFPIVFAGKQRVVEITGEAYLEVAHNTNMPFKVKVGDEVIEVLGTRFNINAYQDEGSVKTTLLEGSVKVSLDGSNILLKPNEQAVVNKDSKKIAVFHIDGESAIAWKNGFFKLTNSDVASIMREISRWYNIDVIYKGNIPASTISGEVPRNLNLSEVLKVLNLSGIRCQLEGRDLVISE